MTIEEFFQLAEKVNEGTASDAELALYNQYFNRFQTERVWNEEKMGNELAREALLYQAIDQKITTAVPVRKLNNGWKRLVSAAAILLIVAGATFYVINREKPVVSQEMLSKSIEVSSKTNELIQLADGSTVILSAGSQLKFPSSFEGKAVREVFLVGKAFFDIKHLSKQPFIVRTGKVSTQVLGTAFDVDSRSGKVTVTVIRGKVVVNKEGKTLGTLTPNKQVVYDVQTDLAKLKDTNAAETVAWREKDLVFNDITLSNAALLLQDRFGVKVTIEQEELAEKRFTTTLFENQSLADCLTLICDFNHAVFEYDPITKQVTIKPKN
ncbi:FecR family protein [Pedobacter sp. PWIIR3]